MKILQRKLRMVSMQVENALLKLKKKWKGMYFYFFPCYNLCGVTLTTKGISRALLLGGGVWGVEPKKVVGPCPSNSPKCREMPSLKTFLIFLYKSQGSYFRWVGSRLPHSPLGMLLFISLTVNQFINSHSCYRIHHKHIWYNNKKFQIWGQ